MPKILVADDEEDQEELIMQKFSKKEYLRGYEFLFARDGFRALQLIKDHADIDLALLDINMPEIDGLTLLEKIKQINPMMRSIMLSGYWDTSNTSAALSSGAFDTLSKPIDLHELGIIIKKALEEVKRNKEKVMNENLILRQNSCGPEIP